MGRCFHVPVVERQRVRVFEPAATHAHDRGGEEARVGEGRRMAELVAAPRRGLFELPRLAVDP